MAKHSASGCGECSCKAAESDVLETLIAKYQGPRAHGGQISGVDYFVLTKRIGEPAAKVQISRSTWRVTWPCRCKAEYERRSDVTWRPCPTHAHLP